MATLKGRPTKYNEDILNEYIEYLDHCQRKNLLPTIYGLAIFLEVHKDTLYEWAKNHQVFSDSLDKLNDIQAEQLIQKSLINQYNSTISKLMLSSNHGMRERNDVTSEDKKIEGNTIVFKDFKNDTEG